MKTETKPAKVRNVKFKIAGLVGTGPTKAAAEEVVASKIKALKDKINDDYTPAAVSWKGFVGVAYLDPAKGWCGAITHNPEDGERERPCVSFGGDRTKDQVVQSMRLHFAKCAWSHDQSDEAPEILAEDQWSDWNGWVEFQRRYKAGKDAGLNDSQAHAYGSKWHATIEDARKGK